MRKYGDLPGDLKVEEAVLEWLSHQVESDEIEDVTDEMLDMLIAKMPSLAVLFCKINDSGYLFFDRKNITISKFVILQTTSATLKTAKC